MLIVEIEPGDVTLAALSKVQEDGRQGQLAGAMSAYLEWIAGRYEQLQDRLRKQVEKLQQAHHRRDVHARLPRTLGQLQAAWEIWVQFALEVGAIDQAEQEELQKRCRDALRELMFLQARYQQPSDAASCFVSEIRAAIASGRAHVADRRGKVPELREAWGWRQAQERQQWQPQGPRIGWVSGEDLYLESAIAYRLVFERGEQPTLSELALRRRLHSRRLLASVDVGRKMLLIRRTLEGRQRKVLHLRTRDFIGA